MAAPTEDDEAWLYGEPPGVKKEEPAAPGTEDAGPPPAAEAPPAQKEPGDKEEGEMSGEEGEKKKSQDGEEGEEDEDEDSDDDVQVTIGDIKPQTYDASKFKTGYQRPAVGATSLTKVQPKGIDLDAQGTINNVPVFEFDLESLKAEEKPWRKPGADITDYFNYGFNEDTWTKYCGRQKLLRGENGVSIVSKLYISDMSTQKHHNPIKSTIIHSTTGGENNHDASTDISPGMRRYAGPPPIRKSSGTIDVIGSTTTRRPARDFREEGIPSAEAQDFKKYPDIPEPVHSMPIPSMVPPPDYSTPPPPHLTIPPPAHMTMPPPMGIPPPNVPPPNMSGPPPGYIPPPDPYESFYPPGHGGPPPDSLGPPMGPGYGYGPPGPPFGPMSGSGPPPPWDTRPGDPYSRGPWNYGPGAGPGSDFSSSDDERERERGRYRDYDRDFGIAGMIRRGPEAGERDPYARRERSRSRDRHRESRHRDRFERDRDTRERERDPRERDRDRDREERHKSRRKREDDDDEHKRSKHKKSKRSKRDKDTDGGAEGASSQPEEPPAP